MNVKHCWLVDATCNLLHQCPYPKFHESCKNCISLAREIKPMAWNLSVYWHESKAQLCHWSEQLNQSDNLIFKLSCEDRLPDCLVIKGKQRTWGFPRARPVQFWDWRLHSVHTVHCTLYTVHYTLYNVHCTLYTLYALKYWVSTVHIKHCTLKTAHYTLQTALCTLHSATELCTLNTSYYKIHTTHCTLHIGNCKLHTAHWILQ